MNGTISRLALQALLGRRRFWLLLAFPVLMIALTVLVNRLTDDPEVGWSMIATLAYPLVLPLVALLATSSVLGPEVDDGSIVYLLSKPVSRHTVALSKWVVAWAATMVVGAGSLLASGLIVGDARVALAWTVAGAVAGTAYSALFLALSAVTRHAVVVGLLFVLLWEGLLGGLLSGVAWLSIGQWGIRVGHEVSDQLVDPVNLPWAIGASVVVTLAGVWFAGDRLRSFALTGEE
ncbi:ABC transporter permease subunit [Nocardioides rotundus]|uniref:ABC transporter permease subunit n=1 Tax=Nocardioides rotundus TaxID=1774216 RepID=UPI001CBD1AE9|nr:ABC transporter permease subunit [Nocardioides rotundus]UAL30569.1 ABC transporter permease subunit [Nocardioides rotundus]